MIKYNTEGKMVNVYPVTPIAIDCNDYKVKVNGKEVQTNCARVSREPFNRRWPGHQRSIEQTELVQFLSLECDEAVDIEITPGEPFDKDKLVIRPLSLGIVPTVTDDGTIKLRLEKAAYLSVEPFGRNRAFHIFADEVKDYGVDKNDPNVIYFGAGEHDAGDIVLSSGQTLFVDAGAVVYANVYAYEADNIRILGRGILDNSKKREVILFEANVENNYSAVKNAKREHFVRIECCKNVLIDGVTLRDSLTYNIRPYCCHKIEIRNVKLIGNWRYNSDGIDMHNCDGVLIENCFIRTYDDSICVKGRENTGYIADANGLEGSSRSIEYFKNVRVRGCTLWNDWGKVLEIGAETCADEIYDVVFEDCDIIHVTMSPLDCNNVDYADVHGLIYRNINVEYDDVIPQPKIQPNDSARYEDMDVDKNFNPPLIWCAVQFHKEYSGGGTRRGKNRDFLFENIRLISNKPPRFFFKGFDSEHGCDGMVIRNVTWNGEKVTQLTDENLVADEFCKNIILE